MDIPRENVFAALVLGGSLGVSDVANIQETRTRSGGFDRAVDLNEDDVFLLLALDDSGSVDDLFDTSSSRRGFGGSDDFEGSGMSRDLDFADLRNDRTDTRVVSQRVTVDRDDLLFSLALRNGGGGSMSSGFGDSSFGDSDFDESSSGDDFGSIADIDRTVTETRTTNRDMNLDDEDVLLSLALE